MGGVLGRSGLWSMTKLRKDVPWPSHAEPFSAWLGPALNLGGPFQGSSHVTLYLHPLWLAPHRA